MQSDLYSSKNATQLGFTSTEKRLRNQLGQCPRLECKDVPNSVDSVTSC